jgi:trehalose synthase
VLQSVYVGKRSLKDYEGVAPQSIIDRLREVGQQLRGLRVAHINATAYGGGISELLRSLVPLMNDLGIPTDWMIIGGDEQFFNITKTMHNALQGAGHELTEEERAAYLTTTERNAAAAFSGNYDVIFIHDPQPAALISLVARRSGKWIWRCHIDTSSPAGNSWEFLGRYLAAYDAAVFTMKEFIPKDFPIANVRTYPPAIDPLSPKNLHLPEKVARQVLDWIGINLDKPFITQVSRFDPWKDPMGVVAAYRIAQAKIPGLQLVLVGSMALDDPEGWEVYRQLNDLASQDRDIHLFTNLTGVGNIEVNAFQSLARVVVQKSIREGFGLVVSEALWKGTPVVAGRAGGIPMQMPEGTGGFLVSSVDECAEAIVRLFKNPAESRELARRGHEHVQEHFLIPGLLLNDLELIRDLVGSAARSGRQQEKAQ